MGNILNAELNMFALQSHVVNCRVCDLVLENKNQNFFDKPLMRTPYNSVIASLGAMIPGWVLLVPTEHIFNLSDRYMDCDLTMLRASVSQILVSEFSLPICMFEHGAMGHGSQTGCGVDHAHLHMLPFHKSLRDSILELNDSLEWNEINASEIKTIAGEKEYLFYSDDTFSANPSGILAIVTEATSQFFRKAIAKELGRDNEFDYRSNFFEEHIRETQFRIERQLNLRAHALG